jgi:hypothetical protein
MKKINNLSKIILAITLMFGGDGYLFAQTTPYCSTTPSDIYGATESTTLFAGNATGITLNTNNTVYHYVTTTDNTAHVPSQCGQFINTLSPPPAANWYLVPTKIQINRTVADTITFA